MACSIVTQVVVYKFWNLHVVWSVEDKILIPSNHPKTIHVLSRSHSDRKNRGIPCLAHYHRLRKRISTLVIAESWKLMNIIRTRESRRVIPRVVLECHERSPVVFKSLLSATCPEPDLKPWFIELTILGQSISRLDNPESDFWHWDRRLKASCFPTANPGWDSPLQLWC